MNQVTLQCDAEKTSQASLRRQYFKISISKKYRIYLCTAPSIRCSSGNGRTRVHAGAAHAVSICLDRDESATARAHMLRSARRRQRAVRCPE